MSKPFKPTIALDFDGVVHSYDSGWRGAGTCPDSPVDGALDWLERIYLDGRFNVAVFSARSASLAGHWAMRRWFRRHLSVHCGNAVGPHWEPLALEIYEWLKWPWFKPSAFITIDDRALCFDGDFSPLGPDALLTFRPWNKRASATPLQAATTLASVGEVRETGAGRDRPEQPNPESPQ